MEESIKEKIKEAEKSAWNFLINRRPITWILIAASIVFGFISWNSMPRELQPEVKLPYISVATMLPGASPADVESLITEPLEKAIGSVSDIKTMSSSSNFNFSSIFIEFEASVDMDKALQDVKDKVSQKKSELPKDATDPVVAKAESNTFSIITFSISGNLPVYELSKTAEQIKSELEKITEISDIQIIGEQKEQIQIVVDQKKAEHFGLTLDQISSIIKYSNINFPIGLISSDKLNYSIRVDDRYKNIEDIKNIPLFTFPDSTATNLYLKDVADVKIDYPKQSVLSFLSINGAKSKPTVSLKIFKKDSANIMTVAEKTKAKVEELKTNGSIPNNTEVVVTNDNSVWISEDLGILTENGLETSALIIVIMFLALGLIPGIIAGLSVPLVFFLTFTIMDYEGLSINSLSLFSLVIALGLLVDTIIVIMVGIHDFIKKGYTTKEAAILSVETYRYPLIGGTLTTIFAFFPMLLVSGILGQFLRTLPLTISATLIMAQLVALTIIPSLATGFLNAEKERKRKNVLDPFFDKGGKKFRNYVDKIISSKRMRFLTLITVLGLFLLSMLLPITGILKTQMFPQTNQNYFVIRIETPKGTILNETEKVTREVENYIYDIKEVDNFITNIGTSTAGGLTGDDNIMGSGTATTDSNIANITVNLVLKDQREKTSYEIAAEFKTELENFKNAKINIQEMQEGPPTEAPITVRLSGKNIENLKQASTQIKELVTNIPKTKNVKISQEQGINEFKFTLDRDVLSKHGLAIATVSAEIRNIIQGINTDTITLDGEEINIVTKYNLENSSRDLNIPINELEDIKIKSPKGYFVSLGELGKYSFEESTSSIEREDQKRILKITSDIEVDANSVEINKQITDQIAQTTLPEGITVGFGGDMEQIAESFRDLFKSMIIGLLLIALTLVLEFNSYKQTFIILLTLPMGLIAIFPGLILLGLDFSFPAFLGIVALAGVVVNNGIVLIDRINESRREGIPFKQAITESTQSRLAPIFLTSLTSVIGMVPLAMTNEFWAGLGYSMAIGLTFSTILTLTCIPVYYYIFEIKNAIKNGERIE